MNTTGRDDLLQQPRWLRAVWAPLLAAAARQARDQSLSGRGRSK